MRHLLISLSALVILGGCASTPLPVPTPTPLQQFAQDLGATHAALSQCESLTSRQRQAHFDTALLALQSVGGSSYYTAEAYFDYGLRTPKALPAGLKIDCKCASTLLHESSQHNLNLVRTKTLPADFKPFRGY